MDGDGGVLTAERPKFADEAAERHAVWLMLDAEGNFAAIDEGNDDNPDPPDYSLTGLTRIVKAEIAMHGPMGMADEADADKPAYIVVDEDGDEHDVWLMFDDNGNFGAVDSESDPDPDPFHFGLCDNVRMVRAVVRMKRPVAVARNFDVPANIGTIQAFSE